MEGSFSAVSRPIFKESACAQSCFIILGPYELLRRSGILGHFWNSRVRSARKAELASSQSDECLTRELLIEECRTPEFIEGEMPNSRVRCAIQQFLTIRHFTLHRFHVHFGVKATNGRFYTCALPGLHSDAKFRRKSDEWSVLLRNVIDGFALQDSQIPRSDSSVSSHFLNGFACSQIPRPDSSVSSYFLNGFALQVI